MGAVVQEGQKGEVQIGAGEGRGQRLAKGHRQGVGSTGGQGRAGAKVQGCKVAWHREGQGWAGG